MALPEEIASRKIFKKTFGTTATSGFIEAREWERGFNAIIERGEIRKRYSRDKSQPATAQRAWLAMTVRHAWDLHIGGLEREGTTCHRRSK